MIGLGIDTGGTCTDAVIYDSDHEQVLSTGKTLTTKRRLEDGIANAIRMLDPKMLGQVRFVSLSTTLATNACVEDRGGRVKLLLIGADRKVLGQVYKDYGFDSLDDILVMDGTPDGGFVKGTPPNWDDLINMMNQFADAQAIGVVQLYPQKNGGAFEQQARDLILQYYKVPVICGSELFADRNIIRRGAGTYLNVRLIPVIRSFLTAVRNVLDDAGIDVPIYVVRSDGSLMKEAFALEHPVETLLCGPAASALGGVWMSEDDDALVVDIGGTTTDVAIIRDGIAVTVDDGIRINGWKTFVKGMFIDTFGLGGDSAIHFEPGRVFLESYRVIPISMICAEYPRLARKLYDLSEEITWFDRYPYEGYVLMHDPADRTGPQADHVLTDWEEKVIEALRKGPMLMRELAEIDGRYQIGERLAALEKDETIMRFGLTPTDMMHLTGDYRSYDTDSARIAARMMCRLCTIEEEALPGIVYEAFVKKLVTNIQRILIERRFPEWNEGMPAGLAEFLSGTYEDDEDAISRLHFTSRLPIIGVGGPSHIFMNQAAQKLGTRAVLPEHARVANALGTLAGKIVVKESAEIIFNSLGDPPGFRIYLGEEIRDVETFPEASSLLLAYLTDQACKKARERGARGTITTSHQIEKKEEVVAFNLFLFGGKVTVTAYGNII